MENNTAEFPVELIKIERDFIKDIQNTFPELTNLFAEDELEYLKEEPDEVYMTDMTVILNLNNGKVVNITSDKGVYNKTNYNCYFENNVKATDGDTVILSDNLDLLSDENYASVYNDVILTGSRGSLSADKVNYDFENEVYKISMYNEDLIKVKITE